MARRFDAVICDIDGCLSPEQSTPMDAAALARVADYNRRAQERGDRPVVTVCSGRPQPFAEAMGRLIGNRSLPLVAENGAWLYHPGANVYDRDPAITPEHLAAVHALEAWVERQLGHRGVVCQAGKSCSVSLYHPDTEYLRSVEPVVRETIAVRRWPFRVSMTWFYINCDLHHISKGTGLDRLIAAARLDPGRLAGIGDTVSDLAIAEKVAYFACPANARDDVKAAARFVSDRPEVEGVLDILDRLIGS